MNELQKLILYAIVLVLVISSVYIGTKLDKSNEPSIIRTSIPIPEGRWYKLELRQPANCNDFPSWFTSILSRRSYDRDDCMKLWSRSIYSIKGVIIPPKERSLPCHIAMWKDVDYNREFCDFKAGDEIWFWREE